VTRRLHREGHLPRFVNFQEYTMTEILAEETPLVFTSQAAAKVADLIAEEGNDDLMLRVYIQGGGCSGFQYGFTFAEAIEDGDTEIVTDGVKLLVDPMSLQYLAGAEIDYTEGLQGAQFVIRNPNATTTCGCGSSFGV
jgi:iron-sulfur cluster insertion protein